MVLGSKGVGCYFTPVAPFVGGDFTPFIRSGSGAHLVSIYLQWGYFTPVTHLFSAIYRDSFTPICNWMLLAQLLGHSGGISKKLWQKPLRSLLHLVDKLLTLSTHGQETWKDSRTRMDVPQNWGHKTNPNQVCTWMSQKVRINGL